MADGLWMPVIVGSLSLARISPCGSLVLEARKTVSPGKLLLYCAVQTKHPHAAAFHVAVATLPVVSESLLPVPS